MGSKTEKNPCAASGCRGACCADLTFYSLTGEHLSLLTPPGTHVVKVPNSDIEDTVFYKEIIRRRDQSQSPGKVTTIYVASLAGGRYDALIDGPCPNLQGDSSCGIYDKRPPHCRKISVGGEFCTSMRKSSTAGGPMFLGNIQQRPAKSN